MQTHRDPLVGNWFIVRDPTGRPIKSGRIRNRTLDGHYNVTVYTEDGPRGELATEAEMAAGKWELHIGEAGWRKSYAQLLARPAGEAHEDSHR